MVNTSRPWVSACGLVAICLTTTAGCGALYSPNVVSSEGSMDPEEVQELVEELVPFACQHPTQGLEAIREIKDDRIRNEVLLHVSDVFGCETGVWCNELTFSGTGFSCPRDVARLHLHEEASPDCDPLSRTGDGCRPICAEVPFEAIGECKCVKPGLPRAMQVSGGEHPLKVEPLLSHGGPESLTQQVADHLDEQAWALSYHYRDAQHRCPCLVGDLVVAMEVADGEVLNVKVVEDSLGVALVSEALVFQLGRSQLPSKGSGLVMLRLEFRGRW